MARLEVEAAERERQEQLLQRKLRASEAPIDDKTLAAMDVEAVRRVQRDAKVGHPAFGRTNNSHAWLSFWCKTDIGAPRLGNTKLST
jgi:hypothetical protein